MLILLALLVLGGLGYGYALMMESDQLVRQAVLQRLKQIAPDWDFRIGRARFDWGRRVRLYDIRLMDAAGETALLEVPQIHLVIDTERFRQFQEIDIQKVRLIQPSLPLELYADGRWNFSGLTPPPRNDRSFPEFEVEDASASIVLHREASAPPARLELMAGSLQLIPSGKREFLLNGEMHINGAGTLSFSGDWIPDNGTWTVEGAMRDVTTSGELTALAASLSPELRNRLHSFNSSILRRLSGDSAPPTSPPAAGTVPARADAGIPDPGVEATFDLQFGASRLAATQEPEFRVSLQVQQGRITNPVLPFPLHELRGQLLVDNGSLELRDFSARNGVTRVQLSGTVTRAIPLVTASLDLSVRGLVLDERLRRRLTPGLGRLYDSLSPTGQLDVSSTIARLPDGRWGYRNLQVDASGGSVAHVKFPYRVRGVEGTVRQEGQQLLLSFRGQAGASPLLLTGTVTRPGKNATAEIEIVARDLLLDGDFHHACPPKVRQTLKELRLEGRADGVFRLLRSGPLPSQTLTSIAASVSDASLEYSLFPWKVTGLSGEVKFDSSRGLWQFSRLSGSHGPAKLAGSGTFRVHSGAPQGQLSLTVAAVDAPLNHTLRDALPETLRRTWDELSLEGSADLKVNVEWMHGRPPDITLPEFVLHNGSLRLKSVPWLLENVASRLAWGDGVATIHSLTATHDDTRLRTRGLLETTPEGLWRLRLNDVLVDDLIPDRELQRALPAALRTTLETLDPDGSISLSGKVELRGSSEPSAPVLAEWELETVHSGGNLVAGVDLKNVHGRVRTRGTWDGRRVQMEGALDLDSVVVLDHQLTQVRGPFVLNDTRLTFGSQRVLIPVAAGTEPAAVPLRERITARAIDGLITLDGAVLLADQPVYRMRSTLSAGRLESYAKRYHPTATDVRGVMNGWIDLNGVGTDPGDMKGTGRLQVSPAALWELPVFVQLFKVLSLSPQDRTAFNYAYMEFHLARREFQFDLIDLVGDALSLRGRGTAGFDGRLALDFYSEMPKNRFSIPVFSFVVGEATRGWVGVEVRGTVGDPRAKFKTAPQLDNALRRFLSAFDPRPTQRAPLFVVPGLPTLPRVGNAPARTGSR